MIQFPKMPEWVVWGTVLAAVATPAQTQPPASLVEGGIVFGPQQHLSGVYVTNFEISKFTACDGSACDQWTTGDPEWVFCAPAACADLEDRIRQLVGSHEKWAQYKLAFIGRRSVGRTEKKFIQDTESKVYLEKIESFTLMKTE